MKTCNAKIRTHDINSYVGRVLWRANHVSWSLTNICRRNGASFRFPRINFWWQFTSSRSHSVVLDWTLLQPMFSRVSRSCALQQSISHFIYETLGSYIWLQYWMSHTWNILYFRSLYPLLHTTMFECRFSCRFGLSLYVLPFNESDRWYCVKL